MPKYLGAFWSSRWMHVDSDVYRCSVSGRIFFGQRRTCPVSTFYLPDPNVYHQLSKHGSDWLGQLTGRNSVSWSLVFRRISHRGGSKSSYPRRCLTQSCALIILNDCIRQTISSSPIFLSRIFIPSTTSATTLVLRTFMRVYTFRIFLAQQRAIRCLTLKGLHASAIAAELKPVYQTDPLALSPVNKWINGANALRKGKLCDTAIQSVEDSLSMI
jgi:hypothetical protein